MESLEVQNRLAENIKRIRTGRKITQAALAEKAGISEGMLKRIELCLSWPSEKTVTQICRALDIDIYHLFLPVAASFAAQQQVQESIRTAVTKSYQNYVAAVLDEVTGVRAAT